MQILRFLLIITIVMCMVSGCTKKSGTSNGSTEEVSVTTGESEISETDEGNTISTSQLIDKAYYVEKIIVCFVQDIEVLKLKLMN